VLRGNIAGVFGSVDDSGTKPSDRSSCPNPKVPVNNGKAGVGNCAAGQNRVASGRSEVYTALWLGCSHRAKSECRTEDK